MTSQATIDDHAQALVDNRGNQLLVPGPTIIPVIDGEPSDFDPGDTITYSVNIGTLGLINVERRVQMMRVKVDEEGVESMELELI